MELKNVQALRARRPAHVRHAPSLAETRRLIQTLQSHADVGVSLAVKLLYGCGLRVSEPLNLRVKDVNLEGAQLTIRAAKGNQDRVVAIPCSALEDLREQLESARAAWRRDQREHVPVALPRQLAVKYPAAQFDWNWAWLFPAVRCYVDPRTGRLVRWRLHEGGADSLSKSRCRYFAARTAPRVRNALPESLRQSPSHSRGDGP